MIYLSLAHNLHDKNKKSNDSTRVLKFNIARVVVCSHAGCFVSTFIIPRQFVHKFHLVRISRKTGSFRKYSVVRGAASSLRTEEERLNEKMNARKKDRHTWRCHGPTKM